MVFFKNCMLGLFVPLVTENLSLDGEWASPHMVLVTFVKSEYILKFRTESTRKNNCTFFAGSEKSKSFWTARVPLLFGP